MVPSQPNPFAAALRHESAPVRFGAGVALTEGDLGEAARWMYGDAAWAEHLARPDGRLQVVPELLTAPAALAYAASERVRGAERGEALLQLAAEDPAAAQAELLAAFSLAQSAAYLDGLEAALGARAFAELAGPEQGYLLGHRLELEARAGRLDLASVASAADLALEQAETEPAHVAALFQAAGPLVRRALLLEIASRHEEEGVFRTYNEPGPGAMLHRFFEMLPPAERSRVAASLDGLLPRASIEALEAGRSWAGRNLPNITRAAESATRYWADRAVEGSIVAQLLGPFAALATEETILPTLLTVGTAPIGAGLYALSPRLAGAVAVPMSVAGVRGLALDAHVALTGRAFGSDRAVPPHERLGAILSTGSGLLLVGTAAFSFRHGRVQPIPRHEKFDLRGYVQIPVEGAPGTFVLIEAEAAASRGPGRVAPKLGAGTPPAPATPRALSAPRVAGALPPPIPADVAHTLQSQARSAASSAAGKRVFASADREASVLSGLTERAAAAARTTYQLHLLRTGDPKVAQKRAQHAASATAKAEMARIAATEDAALLERAIADGSILHLPPAAEARRAAYLAGATGQRIRTLMPHLVATDEAGVRALMAKEVAAGRATVRYAQLGQPKPQTMTVWELDDGSVVRLKPLGDKVRPGPTLSGEIKMNPKAPDTGQPGIAHKLDTQGRPVPKNKHELGLRPKDGAQARSLNKIAMDAGHIEIGR